MSAARDELRELVEQPSDDDMPVVLAEVRRHVVPRCIPSRDTALACSANVQPFLRSRPASSYVRFEQRLGVAVA
jgi:hypothetical protein